LVSSAQVSHGANAILASLPQVEFDRLLPDFELTSPKHGQVVQEPDEPMEYIYFPLTGMISMLTILEDGESIEAATIGSEGVANFQSFLGADRASGRLVIQLPGQFLRIRADRFRLHLAETPQLQQLLGRYIDVVFTLVAQSAACNRLHPVDRRCARWLLMTRDRAQGDEFELTQDFLSQMLGVRRASVSVSASALQDAGLIRYRHGKIAVIDRAGLEAASCECYRVISRRLAQMYAG
jgi:CRP-like cAMP-binding protein